MQTASTGLGRQLCSLPTRHIQVTSSSFTGPYSSKSNPILLHQHTSSVVIICIPLKADEHSGCPCPWPSHCDRQMHHCLLLRGQPGPWGPSVLMWRGPS